MFGLSSNNLEKFLKTSDKAGTGMFAEDDLDFSPNVKERTQNFILCPCNTEAESKTFLSLWE